VQSHGQPVQRRPPSFGTGQLVGLEREQLLNLDWRRRIGKPIPPQIPVLPTANRTPPGGTLHRSKPSPARKLQNRSAQWLAPTEQRQPTQTQRVRYRHFLHDRYENPVPAVDDRRRRQALGVASPTALLPRSTRFLTLHGNASWAKGPEPRISE